jgi:hypothetical protein
VQARSSLRACFCCRTSAPPHAGPGRQSVLLELLVRHLPGIQRHHRIGQLWHEVRKLMIEHFLSEMADLASVGKMISQLALLDANGQAFRYAATETITKRCPT